MKVLFVTGGAGFIGSNFIKYFLRRNKNFIIVNLDKLLHSDSLENLKDIEDSPRYHFIKGDICNHELVYYALKRFRPDYVINFVDGYRADKGLENPAAYAQTNILGSLTLLEGIRGIWGRNSSTGNRFIQISSSEVYGSTVSKDEYFTEESPLIPANPHSASKSGADLMVKAFSNTYGIPSIITRCCNNYGPYQGTESFIPACITSALLDKPITIHGSGFDVREWIHVIDHCIAITRVLFYGKPGEVYNIGTGEEISDIDLAKKILKSLGKPEDTVHITGDRSNLAGRYTMNSYKIRNNLNWDNKMNLDEGIRDVIQWYKNNRQWWEK